MVSRYRVSSREKGGSGAARSIPFLVDSQDGVHTSSNRDSGVGVVFARGISGVFASGRHQPQCDNDHTGMNAGVFTVGGSEIEMTEIERVQYSYSTVQ